MGKHHGAPAKDEDVVNYVKRHPGVRLSEIASGIKRNAHSLRKMIDRLVSECVLVRVPCEKNVGFVYYEWNRLESIESDHRSFEARKKMLEDLVRECGGIDGVIELIGEEYSDRRNAEVF
jgi:hypothetical protein